MSNEQFYSLAFKTINKKPFLFNDLRGKVILIVNTASRCGYTGQYGGLESLYQKYKDQGFVVLGFPSNQFRQEIEEDHIETECKRNFGVTFPLMQISNVNGSDANEVFQYLKSAKAGFLGFQVIKWNFEKFLVDRSGNVVNRYSSATTPESIESDIAKLLQTPPHADL